MSTQRYQSVPPSRRLVWVGVAVAILAWLGGCGDSDPAGPCPSAANHCDPPPPTPSPLVVSDTVLSAAPAGASVAGAGVAGSRGDASVVYVSLAEGEIPTGTSASIQNRRTRITITTPMVAGGFDPVAVEASAGDTLEVEVSSGPNPLTFLLRVPATAPPIVVRTDPADGKRDVPLNARIVIVFSEPIDGATLTGTNIRLKRGAADVPGAVRVADAGQLTAEFVPDEPLAPSTGYKLMVTQGVEDQDGEPLEAAVGVTFTTSSAAATRLVFTVQPSDAVEGAPISPAVEVTVQDALGNTVAEFADSITLALGAHTIGGSLAGTVRVAPLQGVATFGDLWVIGGPTGLTLVASAAGLTSEESAVFSVAEEPPLGELDSIAVAVLDAETQAPLPDVAWLQMLAAPASDPTHQRGVDLSNDGSVTVGLLPAGVWTIAVSVLHGWSFVFPGLHLYADTALTVVVVAGETTVLPDLLLRPRAPLLLVGVESCPWALPDPPTSEDWGNCDSGYWGGVDVRIEVNGVAGTATDGVHYEATIGPAQPTAWATSWDDTPWSAHFDMTVPGEYDVRLVDVAPSISGAIWELVPWRSAITRVRVEQGLAYVEFEFWHK